MLYEVITNRSYAPRRQSFAIPLDAEPLPAMLALRKPLAPVTAYVCAGHSCLAPLTERNNFV